MKNIFINLFILFVVLTGCNNSDNNSNNNSETKQINYLFVAGNSIPIFEYPTSNNVIFKLDDNSRCQIIERGEKETISNKTDYWYKIEYRGIEGWIFGYHTSEKLEKLISYKQDFPFNKKIFGFLEEMTYYKKEWSSGFGESGCPVRYNSLFPIGWSNDGKFAFIKVFNKAEHEGYNSEIKTFFVIQDLDTDEILEEVIIYTNKAQVNLPATNCDILNGMKNTDIVEIRQHASVENCNKGWKSYKYEIRQLLEKYKITQNNQFTLTNRLKINRLSYTTNIELIRTDELGDKVNIYLKRSDGKRKLINKRTKIHTTSDKIYAYILKNPYNQIEVIIYADYEPYETSLDVKIIGTNLKYGFK